MSLQKRVAGFKICILFSQGNKKESTIEARWSPELLDPLKNFACTNF